MWGILGISGALAARTGHATWRQTSKGLAWVIMLVCITGTDVVTSVVLSWMM
jgi:uncharacterized membrane protein YeaQ/YmgE (transglycosylase-associated protein family)